MRSRPSCGRRSRRSRSRRERDRGRHMRRVVQSLCPPVTTKGGHRRSSLADGNLTSFYSTTRGCHVQCFWAGFHDLKITIHVQCACVSVCVCVSVRVCLGGSRKQSTTPAQQHRPVHAFWCSFSYAQERSRTHAHIYTHAHTQTNDTIHHGVRFHTLPSIMRSVLGEAAGVFSARHYSAAAAADGASDGVTQLN